MNTDSEVKANVKEYYGTTLQTGEDLKTDACCTAEAMPDFAKPILSEIHDEVLIKYYGCGIVIPEQLSGCKILDLGSGSGRDCYVLSKLVGENGSVTGVDMTDEQLAVANTHKEYMREKYGYEKSNVEFLKGDIEKLNDLPLETGSYDCIISNCVINLAEDKRAVLKDAFRLLKEGGELYFSDVYADRRIPEDLQKDPVLYGECLSGALYVNDFIDIAREVGFKDPRQVESRVLGIENEAVKKQVGDITFYSITYRLFKSENMENRCEDYGQSVQYKGTVDYHPEVFQLDKSHRFEKGENYTVCGNTYLMLKNSRFSDHFEFQGDFSTHKGLYEDCGTPAELPTEVGGSCC